MFKKALFEQVLREELLALLPSNQELGKSKEEVKMWNASRFCVSSLRRGHANLLCIVPILVYVLPKQVHETIELWAPHSLEGIKV